MLFLYLEMERYCILSNICITVKIFCDANVHLLESMILAPNAEKIKKLIITLDLYHHCCQEKSEEFQADSAGVCSGTK